MTNQRYSFLMCTHSSEKSEHLSEAMESMINQSVRPDEIVIVLDGPISEELESVIKEYQELNPELLVIIKLPRNLGLGLALNEGLKICRNDLVARMDSDDISLLHRCEEQLSEFEKDDELVIVGSYIDEFIDTPSNVISSRVVPSSHKAIVKFSKRRNPFNHPTVMFKRSKVLKLGGYKNFRRNQDLDLFIRMLSQGMKAYNVPKSLLLFRANRDNAKRRKSWIKCSSYIHIIYNSWKTKHSRFSDVLIIFLSQLIIFIMPIKFLEFASQKFLREKREEL